MDSILASRSQRWGHRARGVEVNLHKCQYRLLNLKEKEFNVQAPNYLSHRTAEIRCRRHILSPYNLDIVSTSSRE